ncbi:hypothetical protein KAJ27_10570, partial [bacterium]|nr:hypothetical protein [bacterium]
MEKWFPKAEEKQQDSTLSSIINGIILIPENGFSEKNTLIQYKPGNGAKIYLLSKDASYIEILQYWNNYVQVTTSDENGELQFEPTLNDTSFIFVVDVDNDLRWDIIRPDITSGDQRSKDIKCYLRDTNKNTDVVLTTVLDKSKYEIGEKIKIFLGGYSPEPINVHIEIWDEKNGIGKYIWTSQEYTLDSSIMMEFQALIPASWPSTGSDLKPEYVAYIHFNNTLISGVSFNIGGENYGDNKSPENGVISIDNGAVYTKTLSVSLGLTCESAVQSLIANDAAFTDVKWEPFTKTKSWLLFNGIEGNRTVYIKFIDDAGNRSVVYNDTIYFDNSPPQGGSISMNNGDPQTNSFNVILKIYAHDAIEMKISNNSDFSGAIWEAYAEEKSWPLLPGDGKKTIYALFRDIAGHE